MGKPTAAKPASSCPTCLSWGVLYAGYCRACYDFRRRHPSARCSGCHRMVPLKNDYCRLCWLQAALQAESPPVVTEADLAGVISHQLAFAGTTKMRGPRSGTRLARPQPEPVTTPVRPADGGQLQLHLPAAARAFDWELHAELTNPTLAEVRRIAARMSQAHGWNPKLVAELDRALVILLSGHADERFRYSELVGVLHHYGVSIARVAEVLSAAGLLHDERVPAFETWLQTKLAELAPGIAADVEAWIRTLQRGGPRNHPRNPHTVRRYLRPAHPVLIDWSARYHHLREVTPADITTAIQTLHGHQRRHTLGALRSLMRHAKKTGTIFTDPTSRVRISTPREEPVIVPLTAEQLQESTQAAVTPAARLTLALAAVHAARGEAIRNLQLDDVDLGNRRLTIAGVTRPLDKLTHRLLRDWLSYRQLRWPHTANPHLIINKQTASTTRPVSDNALTAPFRRRAATLEALRVDRQLDEALTHGPDPLHLAVVFGLDETTAVRYSTAARKLLTTPAEQHHPQSNTNPRTESS